MLFHESYSFRISIEIISAFSLISIELIDKAWQYIQNQVFTQNDIIAFLLNNIDDTLIHTSRALFNNTTWPHYGDIRGRANNNVEGFHNKLNKAKTKTQ